MIDSSTFSKPLRSRLDLTTFGGRVAREEGYSTATVHLLSVNPHAIQPCGDCGYPTTWRDPKGNARHPFVCVQAPREYEA